MVDRRIRVDGHGRLGQGPVGIALPSIVAGTWLWLELHLTQLQSNNLHPSNSIGSSGWIASCSRYFRHFMNWCLDWRVSFGPFGLFSLTGVFRLRWRSPRLGIFGLAGGPMENGFEASSWSITWDVRCRVWRDMEVASGTTPWQHWSGCSPIHSCCCRLQSGAFEVRTFGVRDQATIDWARSGSWFICWSFPPPAPSYRAT